MGVQNAAEPNAAPDRAAILVSGDIEIQQVLREYEEKWNRVADPRILVVGRIAGVAKETPRVIGWNVGADIQEGFRGGFCHVRGSS